MIRFLFKQPQPKRFQFKPRYYNETREYLEGRKAAIRQEMNIGEREHGGAGFRSRVQHQWQMENSRKSTRRSNVNILIIAMALFALVYLLFWVL